MAGRLFYAVHGCTYCSRATFYHYCYGSVPLEFWQTHKQIFPRLFEFVKQTLFAPGSTAGIERIFSVTGYILSDRRTRTSDDNFENQLFANVNLDLPDYEKNNGN